jgi:hypothetical protein
MVVPTEKSSSPEAQLTTSALAKRPATTRRIRLRDCTTSSLVSFDVCPKTLPHAREIGALDHRQCPGTSDEISAPQLPAGVKPVNRRFLISARGGKNNRYFFTIPELRTFANIAHDDKIAIDMQ